MAGSTPLKQWRDAGRWPDCLDRIWRRLEQRHGKSAGTREMITLVRAGMAEELKQFERPLPVMDDYDLLLADLAGGAQ